MTISRDQSGLLSQAGHVTGFDGILSERTIKIIPRLTLSETGSRIRTLTGAEILRNPSLVDSGRFVNPPIEHELGVTAKCQTFFIKMSYLFRRSF